LSEMFSFRSSSKDAELPSKDQKNLAAKIAELTVLQREFADQQAYHLEYKKAAERSNVLLIQQLQFSRAKQNHQNSETISSEEVSSLFDKIFMDPDVMGNDKVERSFYMNFKEASVGRVQSLLERLKLAVTESKSLKMQLNGSEAATHSSKKRFTCLVTEIADRLANYCENPECTKADYVRILNTKSVDEESTKTTVLVRQFIDTLIAEAKSRWVSSRMFTAQDAKLALSDLENTVTPDNEPSDDKDVLKLLGAVLEYCLITSKKVSTSKQTNEAIASLHNLKSLTSNDVIKARSVFEAIETARLTCDTEGNAQPYYDPYSMINLLLFYDAHSMIFTP
jgi:hypothetical protein